MKSLPKEVVERLTAARVALEETVEELREYIDGQSETWRESLVGEAYESWIDDLEALTIALDHAPEEPEL